VKLSKLRKKARSRFKMGPGRGRIKYRDDIGAIKDVEDATTVPVAVIRGRAFTVREAERRRHA